MRAFYKGNIIAESNETIMVEGNHYFPPDSIKKEFYTMSELKTTCFWKGVASYFDINTDGEKATNAAWFYPKPSKAAEKIKNYVAFYTNQVELLDD